MPAPGLKNWRISLNDPPASPAARLNAINSIEWLGRNKYDVMATGHNLDDEAARLLGNVLQWQEEYLQKQSPTLPASVEGFAKKVKPLYRMTEREIAAYAVVNRIDYLVEECPMAKGAKMLVYKDALNRLEAGIARNQTPLLLGVLRKTKESRRVHQITQ